MESTPQQSSHAPQVEGDAPGPGRRRSGRTLALAAVGLVLVLALAVGGAFALLSDDRGGPPKAAKAAVAAPRWPDSTVTGAKGSLQRIPGRTITTAGAVLRNVRVEGQINIEADNVTLQNVHVKSGSYYGVLIYGRNARIIDSTVEGMPGSTLAGIAAYKAGTFEALRVNVFHSEDGVRMSHNSSLTDSFVHDLRGSADSHFDAVTADGYRGWRIVGNRIYNDNSQTAAIWVGDPRYAASSGLVEDNLIAGGGYSVYGGPGVGTGIRVVNNRFSARFFPKGGYWGAAAYWSPALNAWTGNKWLDGTRVGQEVRP